MKPGTQGLFLGLTGAICLRLALTGEFLYYVRPWMRWPLLASALILLALGLRVLWAKSDRGSAAGPASAWMMAFPILAVFVINPPALGAYAAQRATAGITSDRNNGPLDATSAIAMSMGDFESRAQWDDTLVGYSVKLTGFVTRDRQGNWYVTRLGITCCAADAVVYRVQVQGSSIEVPAVDSWVTVTGTWRKQLSTKTPRLETQVLDAIDVTQAVEPPNPYDE